MVLPPAQWPLRVDQPGCARDRLPGVEVAVEVADGDDPLRLLRMSGGALTASRRKRRQRVRTIRLRRAAIVPPGMPHSVAPRGAERQCR